MRAFFTLIAFILTSNLAFAQERQWSLDASEREAFLVFGVADTDDVGLSFWCEIGSPKISIFAPVPHTLLRKDQKTRIDVTIDDTNFNIIAKASHTPGSTAASIEAVIDYDGTVIKAAAAGQIIRVSALGHKSSYPLADADFAGLLRVCSGNFNN
jgi:hypothetical protein